LFSELLLGRYQIPLPSPEESLLANHASAVFQENIHLFESLKCDHRSDAFNSLLLPQSELAIEAMGHALAYSAASKAGTPQYILDVYESAVIRRDPAWYAEQAGLDRVAQRIREDAAVTAMLPYLPTILAELEVAPLTGPIASDAEWKNYLEQLTVHSGNALPVQEQFHAML
jgi:acyl-CoA oxidase